jgi:hypothetical protein
VTDGGKGATPKRRGAGAFENPYERKLRDEGVPAWNRNCPACVAWKADKPSITTPFQGERELARCHHAAERQLKQDRENALADMVIYKGRAEKAEQDRDDLRAALEAVVSIGDPSTEEECDRADAAWGNAKALLARIERGRT